MMTAQDKSQQASERAARLSPLGYKPLRNRQAASWNRATISRQRIALQPAGKLFSPAGSLVWMIGLLGVMACITPWIAGGWVWFELIATTVALVAAYDALTLWLTREECAPVLLRPEKGLRGREGQTMQVPLALTGSGRRRLRSEVRVAVMPATPESETAIRVKSEPQELKLGQLERGAGVQQARRMSSFGHGQPRLLCFGADCGLARALVSSGARASGFGGCGSGSIRRSNCESRWICGPGDRRFCAARFTARSWRRGKRRGPDTGAISSACANIRLATCTRKSRGSPRRAGQGRSRGSSNGSRSRKYIL